MKNIRLIELFAGYGSQAMAMKRIGVPFEHWGVVEFDKYAIMSYNAVHGTNYSTTDIRDIHGEDLRIVDTDNNLYFLTYSFPCTDLSVAGLQEGMSRDSGTRSGLLWEVERLLKECNELPQILMMENVTQVHNKKNMPDFQEWLNFLESKGYVNFYSDLNAKDYGVPQNRLRTYMFSFLKSEFGDNYKYNFPNPVELEKKLVDVLEDEVDEKYYLSQEKVDRIVEQLPE